MSRNPVGKLASWEVRLPSLPVYLDTTQHRPVGSLTTGGSRRKDSGCRKAATNGLTERPFSTERLRRLR